LSLSILSFAPPPALAAAASFLVSVAATPIVIRVAHAKGLLAKPRADRWHSRPTALFGGVAIFASIAITALAILPWNRVNIGILLGAAAVFGVGLVDDVLRIKPSTKLIGQIAAASIAVLAGVRVEAVPSPFLFVPLTIVWIVAVTNAFNLIDNMDGLSAGVAAISSAFIGLFAWRQGNAEVATLAATLGGAAAGFLLYNFNPARVFMGDCGSMVLGYVLGASALVGTWKEASNLFLILAAPALLLGVPLFDATLVTVLRTLAGRPVSQGGRDHSSHRLVALGLSERRAVLFLWSVCVTFGLVALGGLILDLYAAAVGALLLLVGIFFFGVYLGQVPVYGPAPAGADRNAPALVNTLLLHKRRIAEVSIDFALICAAYASAYLLRFEGTIPPEYGTLILQTLPLLIVLKMSAFFLFGVYRGVWRYVGIRDLVNLVKAVLAGSVATVIALLLAYRFQGLSRSVFILDGLLLLFFTTGARLLIRVFRETLGSGAVAGGGRRILIVGAGDGGEMLLREIRNNPGLGWTCVGLVDDSREKHGRQLHGVTVLGGRDELKEIAARTSAEEIVIAIPSASGETIAELAALCAATGLPYRTTRRVTELVEGRVTLDSIREVEVLDVVQRRERRFEDARVREAVAGKSIAIVGAGGTIGAAIALRAAAFSPARILLVDRDDNALLRIAEQVSGATAVLADVTDEASLDTALRPFGPDLVIHAAALNQFRLLEQSPARAARVNVVGTRSVARVVGRIPGCSLLLVSSTKAAATGSVLGATRRLAEIAAGPSARVVRLGNVLGSRGGILARFREQALAGGPITVTDPEAARFVLAAEEAAAAVLLAAGPLAPPTGERVLFPDHGPQVRIAEVAGAVARWAAAAQPGRAPEIRVVGLRPGEALRDVEPMAARTELVPGLSAFAPDPVALPDRFFDELEAACATADDDAVRALLGALPGFGERVPSRATVVALPRRER
jgi:UDP-GlcNAc:undecaprenyl-phosphate GlcNAc-1-phosphate transferase